jgi:LmbE family N-acetylglucosaminyl deacetylase
MKVVCIGAHPDDIEIGCGGTVARHVAHGDEVYFIVMTSGDKGAADNVTTREAEQRKSCEILGVKELFLMHYKDTEIPNNFEAIMKVEDVINKIKPDRVYTAYHSEIHQDHRTVNQISLSACRNVKQILMYEGPSTHSNFHVNFWVNIDSFEQKKIDSIKAHASEGEKEILKIDAIMGMNTFRGYQARSTFAEGFVAFRYLE